MASKIICGSRALLRNGMRRCQCPSARGSSARILPAREYCTQKRIDYRKAFDATPSAIPRISRHRQNFWMQPNRKQPFRPMSGCSQYFENESEYHIVADETLEDIQDAVEMAVEDHDIGSGIDDGDEQPEVVYASGVLTMSFPPHGTWVLNKQTPNRQIWWSSPLSGPRRYEYDPETSEWIYTRSDGGDQTLSKAIVEEVQEIYGVELDL